MNAMFKLDMITNNAPKALPGCFDILVPRYLLYNYFRICLEEFIMFGVILY